jgi:hypothetical protein
MRFGRISGARGEEFGMGMKGKSFPVAGAGGEQSNGSGKLDGAADCMPNVFPLLAVSASMGMP